ncbi:MAG: hypothetical protein LC799_21955, partial [Actinobacteria bacterium]|nr:hypothetical protein [Actinomycetota bacterium]
LPGSERALDGAIHSHPVRAPCPSAAIGPGRVCQFRTSAAAPVASRGPSGIVWLVTGHRR